MLINTQRFVFWRGLGQKVRKFWWQKKFKIQKTNNVLGKKVNLVVELSRR